MIKKFLLMPILLIGTLASLGSCTPDYAAMIGLYSSSENGQIEITSFDGDEANFIASGLKLPRLNGDQAYNTPQGSSEIFVISRASKDQHLIRFSLTGVSYLGAFDSSKMLIEIEGISYLIN